MISRRDAFKLLGVGGAAALVGSTGLAQTQTGANTMATVPNGSGFNRLKVGEFTVVVLSDGQSNPGPLLPNWGFNPELQDEFRATLIANFINPDATRNNFHPVLVDTGRNKVLIDTGNGVNANAPTGRLLQHLALAGYKPEDIDTVFLTHLHGDHMNGLTNAQSAAIFPNARVVMGEAEHTFWTKPATGAVNANVTKNIVSQAAKLTLVKPGAEIVPGLTTVDSAGHTPGHLSVLVASGTQQMMVFGDAAGHYLLSLQYPQAVLGFDNDKQMVVGTRARLFERVSTERMLVTAYHFPFPATGYIRKRAAGGYEFVPAALQF
jgi:glyoxylase-like metal-dependent hydrolase (beta-lactamase superfamily II)